MARFFMAGTNKFGGTAIIRGQDAEHIRVLRMKPGERVVICDGKGTDYMCRLVRSEPDEAEAEVIDVVPCKAEPSVSTTIFAGLPKGERADVIVQKCTEAGATGIVFFGCERSIVKTDGRSMEKKLQRWQRIAESAAQQSGRGMIPAVDYAWDFVQMLDLAVKSEGKFLMYETGDDRVTLQTAFETAGGLSTAAIITGPEGGFSEAEAKMARLTGFTACSMGERILRCETAPVIALSALMYATNNL